MRTYRELFRAPEYRPLFVTSTFQVTASTMTGPALATLGYADTGSPFLAAFVMFGPSLAQVTGALVLLSAADRLPARSPGWLSCSDPAPQSRNQDFLWRRRSPAWSASARGLRGHIAAPAATAGPRSGRTQRQALGLHASTLLTMQGVGATLAGVVAEATRARQPRWASCR
ncbi:hypothetical protein [Actinophytocola sp.]|uniref:hypothetical protein n=1 Tax=Actinophytocola sp. TaxID=1872138 RepID=UPI0025C51404|nr:hypothetical protein [Actinophytocola sp.]